MPACYKYISLSTELIDRKENAVESVFECSDIGIIVGLLVIGLLEVFYLAVIIFLFSFGGSNKAKAKDKKA